VIGSVQLKSCVSGAVHLFLMAAALQSTGMV
jgi:hypothetical protein